MSAGDDFRKLASKVLAAAASDGTLKEIGDFAVERIRTRTRQGYGVNEKGGKRERLAELSEGYINRRKYWRKVGYLSTETTPSRSNLTKTGAMLNSLTARVGDSKVDIEVTGAENKAKVEANAKIKGRVFLNLSDIDLKEIRTRILTAVIKTLRK